MEEVKNEILTLTKDLRENLSKPGLEYLDVLEKMKEKVKELNNEQIQKKFNDIVRFVVNEDITIKENLNKVLDYIEYFEKSVEKNYLKDNGEMLPTIDNFRKAITDRNQEEIVNCSQEFIQYMKSLNDSNKVKAINNKLSSILAKITKKNIKDLTEDEINELINQTNELSDIMNDKVEIKEDDKKDIPDDLASIRKEMDEILGKSLFEGIENEYEFAISYQLDDYEVDKFQTLRNELKELLNNPIDNKTRIDEIRVEMFIILGVDPYTYKDNKKIIDALEEPNKSRFAELKAKYDELMEKKNSPTNNTDIKVQKKSYDTEDEIRNRMAEILSKPNHKIEPYEGIENTNIHAIDLELDENEKDEFQELQEKLKKIKKVEDETKTKEPTGLIPVTPTPPVPTPTPEPPKKKKGRLVKFAKSAKEFYKRHKKVILLVGGIVLAAIALPHIIPSIMHFNSILWHKFIAEGALATTGIPKALNDINLLIGHKIGATYASGSGIWTLANGAILNEGAKTASLLASVGKIALSTGAVGVGTTVAVKNAYRLAKEKIENFKNREKKPKAKDDENKTNIFTNVKESFTKGFEKGKSKVTEEWNKRKGDKKDPEPPKNPTEPKNENKGFQRDDVSDRINRVVNLLIDREIITEKEREELEKADKKTFMTKFKEIFNRYNIDSVKKENEEKVEFTRTDVNFAVSEFIKYCQETGIYTDADIKKINEMNSIELRDYVYADPRFAEFEKMRTEWSNTPEEPTSEVVEEEKGKGL